MDVGVIPTATFREHINDKLLPSVKSQMLHQANTFGARLANIWHTLGILHTLRNALGETIKFVYHTNKKFRLSKQKLLQEGGRSSKITKSGVA